MAQDRVFTLAGLIEETVFGTTPAAALQRVNAESFSLSRSINNIRPEIFTNDRRRYPMRFVQEDGAATIGGPMQYANLTLLQEGLFMADESALVDVTGITISGATNQLLDSANGFAVFENGDMLWLEGAIGTNVDGWYGPAMNVAAGSIDLPAGQLVDFAAGSSVTVKTRRLTDGEVAKSYSLEYQLTKLTTAFRSAAGFRVQMGRHQWQQGQFVTESYELIGRTPSRKTATIGTGAALAAPITSFMNSVQDFHKIRVDGGVTTLIVSSLTAELRNTLSPFYGLGVSGPQDIVFGPLDGTVQLSVLMTDAALAFLDQIEDQDTVSLDWSWQDQQGNSYCYFLPALKADEGNPDMSAARGLAEMTDVSLSVHDPAKDFDSAYNAEGFDRQVALYRNS